MEGEIVALVAVIGGITTVIVFMVFVKDIILGFRRRGPNEAGINEIRALREEIQQLRQQNTDIMLGVDATLQTLTRRIEQVDQKQSELARQGVDGISAFSLPASSLKESLPAAPQQEEVVTLGVRR